MKVKSLKSLKNKLGIKGKTLNHKQLSQVIGGSDCGAGEYCSAWKDDYCIRCSGGGWTY